MVVWCYPGVMLCPLSVVVVVLVFPAGGVTCPVGGARALAPGLENQETIQQCVSWGEIC